MGVGKAHYHILDIEQSNLYNILYKFDIKEESTADYAFESVESGVADAPRSRGKPISSRWRT
ncbi:protein of unknown function [Nitrospina watsonii]|uniref:Uncharacterized protein n=1 Tax=Nitrospina watsonii TaxID=1323948 RepID=A0ABM9HGY6_9BACT|nr:protein of unknown function [Nitrospina watsonii]